MKTKEVKQMIIDNFIDHLFHEDNTSCTKEEVYAVASLYVEEDHVDEIAQAEFQFNAIDAFTHFLYYAEPDFVEKVWADEPYMAKHFREKLNGLIRRDGGYMMSLETLVRFNQELTYEYQKKLYTYIIENHSNKWRSNG